MSYKVEFTTKWSDFDPNRHMRHTAYNEYAAEVKIRYFAEHNFSIQEFTTQYWIYSFGGIYCIFL